MSSFRVVPHAVIDDFEHSPHRWKLSGWQRSNANSHIGNWSLGDRAAFETGPRTALAEVDEQWSLASLEHARLTFWEYHDLDWASSEAGYFEVSDDSGANWNALLRLTGSQRWWAQRNINLDEYAHNDSPPIRIRFRTTTPEAVAASDCWFLDDISLSVGNIVAVNDSSEIKPDCYELSTPFPNPANGRVLVNYRASAITQLRLIDIAGRSVLTLPVASGSGTKTLELGSIPTGIYYLKLDRGGVVLTKPLIILK